jgi:uncharacterized membrane protein YqjE
MPFLNRLSLRGRNVSNRPFPGPLVGADDQERRDRMSDTRSRKPPPAGGPTTRKPRQDAEGRKAFGFSERGDDEDISSLLRRLADQGTHLAEQHAELVRAEISESVADVKQAAGAMAGAAILGLAGLGVLLMGISFALAEAMSLWLATLIVAAATLAGAFMLYSGARQKLNSSSLSARRTRRTLERAPDAISGKQGAQE